MKIRPFMAACGATGALVLALPAVSQAEALKLAPRAPYVDDDITVSFVVAKRLRSGYHYEGSVATRSGGDCAALVFKSSSRRPSKGRRMSFHFSSYDDELSGGPEWCQGKASVVVDIVRNGGTSGRLVGTIGFRFRAKP